MLTLAVAVHSTAGFAGSLLAIPFLFLADSKARLGFTLAFGIVAMLGTAAFVLLIPATSCHRAVSSNAGIAIGVASHTPLTVPISCLES